MKKTIGKLGIKVSRQYIGLQRFFHVPPFSVFRAAEGWWQQRKRMWIKLGIKSEIGRGENSVAFAQTHKQAVDMKNRRGCCTPSKKGKQHGVVYAIGNKKEWEKGLLHKGDTVNTKDGDKWDGGRSARQNAGTSIFDPVLCEIMYRWFCPTNGQIIDPFAGGSVRGIVATVLNYKYWGCDLNETQIKANEEQAQEIIPDNQPEWVHGDSKRKVRGHAPEADLIFSCPPYGNLEVYSDSPSDISNMSYEQFIPTYNQIIKQTCRKLKQNRFACFVVANYRDKVGFYHDLVGDTVRAFENTGCGYYNEAILITATGSLPIRVTKQFQAGRKLGKTHQNILIFYKGDPKKIKSEFGPMQNRNE